MLRGPFFTFPDNFTPSILIAKKISHLGVKVRGRQRPQIGLRSQNFKIVTFSHGSCDLTVRPRCSVVVLFCMPEGPLGNALTSFKATPTILPQAPRGAPPPKNFAPHFRQILRGRGQISAFIIRGRPKRVREKNFGNYTWPTSRK